MTYSPKAKQAKPLEAVFEIDADGNFDIDVLNGDGKNCRQFTAELEQALGTVTNRELKPEFHRDQPASQAMKRRATQSN